MTTVYQIARLAQTAGLETTFVFKPQDLTTRIRNAAKRMIETQALVGGYRSQAKKVAKLMLLKHGIPYVAKSWRGVEIGELPYDVREKIAELRKADYAAFLLEHPGAHEFYRDRFEENLQMLQSGEPGYVSFNDDSLGKQAFSLLVDEFVTHRGDKRVKEVAALLDTDTPIQISANYASML